MCPRELIDTGTDKRFVRRDEDGQFRESDDVGKSLAQDQRRRAIAGSCIAWREFWSGRRDSNPRPQPWQGCALPLSYARSAPNPGSPGGWSGRLALALGPG